MKWESKKERAREREIETLSCWGEVERPLPWMPTSASMSEFSDSVIDSCSTWEHRNTKLLDSLLRNFEGLGETKVEREHDDESKPILLFTFTTLRVRAIVVNVTCYREKASYVFLFVMCVDGAKIKLNTWQNRKKYQRYCLPHFQSSASTNHTFLLYHSFITQYIILFCF
jgi:hypothetical protein